MITCQHKRSQETIRTQGVGVSQLDKLFGNRFHDSTVCLDTEITLSRDIRRAVTHMCSTCEKLGPPLFIIFARLCENHEFSVFCFSGGK